MTDFPDSRPVFEARALPDRPWIWEVWDIEHPAECNHFPIMRVDSKGAAEDFHEEIARLCVTALNMRFAAEANRRRREEAQGIAPEGRGREGGPGSSELPSPVAASDAPKGRSS